MLKEGMFIQERYEIISRIGSGGMADVYKAKDHKLNRFVAVKVLKNEFRDDKVFISKFRTEAQSAAGLAHPNIVNVYDVGEDHGVYFIVMELVEGITLKEYIEKKGRLGVREATSIAVQVSMGLETAITRAIGARPRVMIDFFDMKLLAGDRLLLCSDGLSNMLEDQEIEHIVKKGRDLPKIARELVARANQNGGKDNIAVVLVEPLTGEVEEC